MPKYILLGKAGFLFPSLSLQCIPKGSANPTWLNHPVLALESPQAVGTYPLCPEPLSSELPGQDVDKPTA